MSTHDNADKNVFSHPRAVQDLLRGFGPLPSEVQAQIGAASAQQIEA